MLKSAIAPPAFSRGYDLISTCRFHVRSPTDIDTVISFLQPWFSNRPQALDGIAALLHNGIEHGLLGLGEQGKATRLNDGSLRAFIQEQVASLKPEKQVELALTRKDGGTYIIVQDTGEGFNWKPYLNVDPTRANQPNGRGIARAVSLSFDKLTYNEKGNQAVAFVADTAPASKG